MPIRAGLDLPSQTFRTTVTGTVSIDDLNRHIATVRSHGGHQYPGLVDARGVHTLTFNGKELMKLAHYMHEVLGPVSPAPRAVVVDGLVHFGMARLFASLVAGWMRIGVFDDVQSAEAWLGAFIARASDDPPEQT